MAKRSNNGALWLLIGVVALIAMVPREVWIGLGVLSGIAFVAFVGIKLHGNRSRPNARPATTSSAPREPTLAELMARDSSAKTSGRTKASAQERVKANSKDSQVARQSKDWVASRESLGDENRQRTELLRAKFPPMAPSIESAPALSVPTQPLPMSTQPGHQAIDSPANDSSAGMVRPAAFDARVEHVVAVPEPIAHQSQLSPGSVAAARPVPEHALSQAQERDAIARQSQDWNATRAKLADAGRERSEHLRDKHSPAQLEEARERFYSASTAAPSQTSNHAIPAAPAGYGQTRWLKAGESFDIAGLTISGGMLYLGPKLTAPDGGVEPALVNPQLPVANQGDFRYRQTSYWPKYGDLTPETRRAYLSWLAQGRSHPQCELGLVFLYFYGLERRAVWDSQSDPAAKDDWPDIREEVRRLLSIYGNAGSFNHYAGALLNWLELGGFPSKLYQEPIPDLPRSFELPPYLRLALGQASIDRVSLPPALAISWLRLSPDGHLRTAATRCPVEFERLFSQRYQDAFGAGMVLPKNRTKLKFVYQPASPGLLDTKLSLSFGDVPDVSALSAPIRQLREIAEQCTEELGSYSRMVGKDPSMAGSLEGLLLLPATLWPDEARARLAATTQEMRDGRLALTLSDLISGLGGNPKAFNRERVRSLARALEAVDVGFEPYVLAGARAPGEEDVVVIFAQPTREPTLGVGAEFQTAALTLQLAAAMAQADGEFHEREVAHLRAEIDRWTQITPAERQRLHAHLQWLAASPPTLASLKKKLEPLSTAAKETLAAFMAALAQADGYVSPDEVKFLEKIYKTLGVEPNRVFSDVHSASAGGKASGGIKAERKGFHLDADRIASLQEDTAKVSVLLSKIFAEEPTSVPLPVTAEPEPESEAHSPLGLDEVHSIFLRLLLSRPEWTRSELEDAAADLELMLDGALEQINEAAFDAFDEALCEGDDPIEVHTYLLEKIEA